MAGSGDAVSPMWSTTGSLNGRAASFARRSASRSFLPTTFSDSRTLTPTIRSRCRWIAARAAFTSAAARSSSSPFSSMPVRAMLISARIRLGAPFATSTIWSIVSAPRDPASTSAVTPSDRQMAGISGERACVWMSMRPGTTSFPAAPIVAATSVPSMRGATRAIRPLEMATSAMPSNPRDGSITRPPVITRS